MKLRYYLRGLGIGIVVTALIMTIASSGKDSMTDEEIMQRAAELGMVTQKTLISQVQDEGNAEALESLQPTEMPVESSADVNETPTPEQEIVPTEIPTQAPTEVPTAEPTKAPTQEPAVPPTQAPQPPAPGEKATLTVYSGEHSLTVAKRMQELGLIEDYQDFDDYLCDHGYSRYVNSGVYKIAQGLSYEELAKIITRTDD